MAFTVEAPPSKTASLCSKTCPKGKKAGASIKTAGFTFCICGIDWLAFNNGPGYVEADFNEQMAFAKTQTPQKTMWFRSGSQGQVIGNEKPAWDIDALIGFDEVFTNASEADKWQIGFIQTVEKLVWTINYENSWVRKATAQAARDAIPATTPAPWVTTVSGAKSTPVTVDKMGTDHPTLFDEPMLQVAVISPDADAWCRQIRSVSVEGKFHLWLIAKDTRVALDLKSLVFMYRASIDMKKEWTLKSGGDPFFTLDWQATGSQTKADGFGQGSQTPVLEKPIANQQMTLTTTNQGTKCGKKPASPKAPSSSASGK